MNNNSFRADLHCHTAFSDGSLTPQELILLAKKIGLQGLAITDHDTVDSYDEAIPAAKEAGLWLGSGVEFSCYHKNKPVHILGYDFRLSDPGIHALCQRHQTRRIDRNRAILAKLERCKMPIREEELTGARTIGRPHIAQVMVQKGYVKTIKDAFNLYLAEGKMCYEPGAPFSISEAFEVVRAAGGKAFLAHPHLLNDGIFLKELLALKFDGIECHYARCSPEKERRYLKIAKEKNLLISGGSDYHGDAKEQIPLGCSWVDEETFRKIFQHPLSSP